MSPRTQKLALTLHVISSAGWLGAVIAFLPLAVVAAVGEDAGSLRASYVTMDIMLRFAIVPLAFGSLVTGLIQSLGTTWGLFRHYWVVVKFVVTVFATVVLLQQIGPFRSLAAFAAAAPATEELLAARSLRPVVHAGGGLVVLLLPMVLSIYKPRGVTRYGRRTTPR